MAKLTQDIIGKWIQGTTGHFHLRTIHNEVGIGSDEGKSHLRVILNRLCQKKVIAPLNSKGDGWYRVIDSDAPEILWQNADPEATIPLKFPFELEKYAKIFPKSIVIVAGTKNAGKTGFLYKTIVLNMYNFAIDLFNSETGKEQMKERFGGFDIEIPNPPPFRTLERYENFSDVIDPNRISIIDYLDLDSEIYMVGAEINKIFQKLQNGVAVIGLQKPPGRDLAYGAGFTAKRATLYIALDSNKIKIVYAKNPAQRGLNPNNMQWTFLWNDSGTDFINVQKSYEQNGL